MSYVFDIDDITVWSPALRTGNIYAGFVKVIEEEFHQVAGFTAVASDMARIDGQVFTRFVNLLLETVGGPNANRLLGWHLRTVLGPSIVMLQRADYGGNLVGVEAVFKEAEVLELQMPR